MVLATHLLVNESRVGVQVLVLIHCDHGSHHGKSRNVEHRKLGHLDSDHHHQDDKISDVRTHVREASCRLHSVSRIDAYVLNWSYTTIRRERSVLVQWSKLKADMSSRGSGHVVTRCVHSSYSLSSANTLSDKTSSYCGPYRPKLSLNDSQLRLRRPWQLTLARHIMLSSVLHITPCCPSGPRKPP